jgi:antitoxin component YwqK of YwqJK toxin-antitoxin module
MNIEDNSVKDEVVCYICYEPESEKNPFMNPDFCKCKGSIKIHNACFNPLKNKEKVCSICTSKYIFSDGPWKWYYQNGVIAEEGIAKNNFYYGLWKFYYPDGTLKAEKNYNEDVVLDGPYKEYYNNGTVKVEMFFLNGDKEGVCKFYYENGNPQTEEFFKNGKLEGLIKFYHECGLLHIEEFYENGVLNFRKSHFLKV